MCFLVLFLCNLDVLALALVRLAVVQLEDDKAQSLGQRKYKLHKYMLHFYFILLSVFASNKLEHNQNSSQFQNHEF